MVKKIEIIKLVQFTCEHCKCKSELRFEDVNLKGEELYPFPYSKGWIYLHEFNLKLSSTHSIRLNRLHFCSETCFCDSMQESIDKSNTLIKRRKN